MNDREKLLAVRNVLLQEWDPIGVRHEPTAQDEYDQYLRPILALVEQRASTAALVELLGNITADMGLVGVEKRDIAVAERLRTLQLG